MLGSGAAPAAVRRTVEPGRPPPQHGRTDGARSCSTDGRLSGGGLRAGARGTLGDLEALLGLAAAVTGGHQSLQHAVILSEQHAGATCRARQEGARVIKRTKGEHGCTKYDALHERISPGVFP